MSPSLHRRHLLLAALVPALSVSALGGCGFALRRDAQYAFRTLMLHAPQQSATAALLHTWLAAAGVHLTTQAAHADVVLTIHSDQAQQQVAAMAAGESARALLLIHRVVFSAHTPAGGVLIDRAQVQAQRDISYSDSLAAAKQEELALTYTHLRQDVARQILQRLASIPASALSSPPESPRPPSAASVPTS